MALTLPLLALLALADPKVQARDHAKKAGVAYNLGHYDEAATEYEAAYRLIQDPVLLYNIGQSHRLAGHPEKALAAYKGFLRTAEATDPNRAAVETRVGELERQLADRNAPPPEPKPPLPLTQMPEAPKFSTLSTNVYEPPLKPEAETPSRFRTTAGAGITWGTRDTGGAVSYQLFGRMRDTGQRLYEIGYFKRPIYPMFPTHQFAALYGSFRAPAGWSVEAGGLGAQSELFAGGGYHREIFDLGARIERIKSTELCGSNETVVYFVPEGRLKIPASTRLTILGYAGYRGKLQSCEFSPSMATLDLSARLTITDALAADGGVGHYALFDHGSGDADPVWPSRTNGAEQVHIGGRYAIGKIALIAEYRLITYARGTHLLTLSAEFRSTPDAP